MANKVELYNNGVLIGTDNAPVVTGSNWSYSIPYTAASGDDVLTAKAFIDNVEVASSGVRNVTINAAAGGGIDADYQAVLDYWTANAIALPDSAQQTEDNQIMLDAKSSGVWAKSDAVGYMAGNVSKVTAARLTDWKRLVQMTPMGTVTYGANGAKGDGSTGYIKTGFIPSTHGVNYTKDAAGIVFLTRENATNEGAHFGIVQTDNNTQWTEVFGTDSYMNVNGAIPGKSALKTRNLGLNGVYRTSPTSITVKNATDQVHAFSSTVNPIHTIEMYLLTRNSNGASSLPTNGSIAFFAIGGNMLNEHAALKTALE